MQRKPIRVIDSDVFYQYHHNIIVIGSEVNFIRWVNFAPKHVTVRINI
jgi:hypothetical protein